MDRRKSAKPNVTEGTFMIFAAAPDIFYFYANRRSLFHSDFVLGSGRVLAPRAFQKYRANAKTMLS